ncbi:iron-sulfur cluster co-chaperone protein HscB homolog [Telopea speciosissima]|uniref:iron-sulfur cluster co-chaperone protein HscB homolog n=1 Tax=Telopea speciosissima TaxID=54955 RepID=UPI001CC5F439|nr:iron-sulfur cluster co-chaperone protein HscB homolog [Telopea speciosissima]XP_043702903.1 iron-sulfur cluster co-chaperone protein HscB homolog [Telopea speciosissima]XP_043702904.1 iron-sulfur cluster co-chaperone protein HscB homolog [Telopea speciosissima]
MSNRKLWISALRALHRNFRSTSRFSIGIYPKLESSGVFSFSYEVGKPPGYGSCRDRFAEICSFSSKNFCSESADGGVSRCWNCSAVSTSKLFLSCESCKSVQPVDTSVDYFQIFGLDKKYEIKGDSLEKKYKDWQKKLHPDLVHSKSEKEKEYAAEQSARVIDAYRTLINPLSRAIYMLRLESVHVDEETTVSDPELLAEIMEIREAVEEADDPQSLNKIQCQMQDKLESWSKSFGDAFKNRKFEEAITSTQRMTYYERVKEEIMKKL